ncbi:hypothetical protein Tco_0745040 [Tanacetum coccineum]
MESRRFVMLQKKLGKAIRTTVGKFVRRNRTIRLMDLAPASSKAAAKGEKESQQQSNPAEDGEQESSNQVSQTSSALVIHSSEEPPIKKLKVVLEDIPIPSPTLLNSIRPPIIISNIPYDQYTANLFSSRSSEYSPTPPLKVADKRKGIASKDDQIKQIMPLTDEGGSTLSFLNLNQFRAAGEGQMTLEDAKAQMEEIKRLAELNAGKEKAKMMEEYNHRINFKDDPLLITKFSYRKLGFIEWLELHALASKSQTKANDQLLRNLKAKFRWVATQAGKLGISPPPKLITVDIHPGEKKACMKRKRIVKVIHEVFIKEDIVVDGMHRFLVPPAGVVGSPGLVIAEPEAASNEGLISCKASTSNEGLAEYKASTSNLRSIQVKDIVNEIEDYLKTYSSAGMDISCLYLSTKLVKVVNSWQNCSLKYGRDVSKNGLAFNADVLHHRILDTLQPPPLRKQPRITINRECCKE